MRMPSSLERRRGRLYDAVSRRADDRGHDQARRSVAAESLSRSQSMSDSIEVGYGWPNSRNHALRAGAATGAVCLNWTLQVRTAYLENVAETVDGWRILLLLGCVNIVNVQ